MIGSVKSKPRSKLLLISIRACLSCMHHICITKTALGRNNRSCHVPSRRESPSSLAKLIAGLLMQTHTHSMCTYTQSARTRLHGESISLVNLHASSRQQSDRPAICFTGWRRKGLRSLLSQLSPVEVSLAGHAVAVTAWHAANEYCGRYAASSEFHVYLSFMCKVF